MTVFPFGIEGLRINGSISRPLEIVASSKYCYNPARGDYNTVALIFRVAAARFLDVSEEKYKI